DLGSFLSWTWYFFHKRFDEVDPIIANRLKHLIRERILDPYMQRSDYWWQAFNYHPGVLVNNWNPWCNSNVLLCNLLIEDDRDKLAKAVYRTMQSVDEFINYVKSDGACEEGSSYWGHAAGKLYDYLQILNDASGGKLSLLQDPMIKRMGEYIARSYVGNGWVVNFADASAKGGGEPGLIYRYGKATGSEMMQHFAAYLLQQQGGTEHWSVERDFFRSVENIISLQELQRTSPALPDDPVTWYPETEVCYIRNSAGYFLAAKGGNNNESHNHNDVGSFSLYINQQPVFIDAGVGTYTRQTFSSERYKIWTMQSNYHNLPLINNLPEQFGSNFRASDVSFDSAHAVFKVNISGAYPKDAAVDYWKRQYQLDDRKGLLIKDEFKLTEVKGPIVQHFMTRALPDISKKGVVLLTSDGATAELRYDPVQWDASVDEIPQTDPRLSRVWGKAIYRLVLTAKKKGLKGSYVFRISKL
ncbi:MAG TPA: heparinase II/III family protein, partial [Chitinophagaceae bacterium]|nr:heparinase II/III family protein [Chitinophagaceae bacterium]